MEFTGEWDKVKNFFAAQWMDDVEAKGMKRIAAMYEKEVRLNIRSRGKRMGAPFKPLAEATIRQRIKGSKKPLLDKGELVKSIKAQEVGDALYFIGIPNGAKHKDTGADLVKIATIHEHGAITPHGEIPRRSFLRPVTRSKDVKDKAIDMLKKYMNEKVEQMK